VTCFDLEKQNNMNRKEYTSMFGPFPFRYLGILGSLGNSDAAV
jgi:hypothetical protein